MCLCCFCVLHFAINAHMSGRSSQVPRPVPCARGQSNDLPLEMDAETTLTKRQRQSSTSSNGSSSSTGANHHAKPVKKKSTDTPDTSDTACSSASAVAGPTTPQRLTPASAGTFSSTRPATNPSPTTPITDTSCPPLHSADDIMPPPPPPAATYEQDDGFTTVTNRRRRSRAH